MIVNNNTGEFKPLLEGIQLKNLAHSEQSHLVEVRIEKDAIIPEHHHPQEQTGYLITGSLKFFSEDKETIAGPGDSWNFKGGVPHGAEALEDTVVIELFVPARDDYLELG